MNSEYPSLPALPYISPVERTLLFSTIAASTTELASGNLPIALLLGLIVMSGMSLIEARNSDRLNTYEENLILEKFGAPYKIYGPCTRLHFQIYHGRDKKLSDGTKIKNGDPIGDLQIWKNTGFLQSLPPIVGARLVQTMTVQALLDIGEDVKKGVAPQVKAIFGETHLGNPSLFKSLKLDFERPDFLTRFIRADEDSSFSATDTTSKIKGLRKKYKRIYKIWISPNQLVRSQPVHADKLERAISKQGLRLDISELITNHNATVNARLYQQSKISQTNCCLLSH
ncbi:hypothetical protein HY310_03640 [Candidatus Microgenomates bacterium]|nr:hypothetical protein [Candidatus Microgenomates bacterium]